MAFLEEFIAINHLQLQHVQLWNSYSGDTEYFISQLFHIILFDNISTALFYISYEFFYSGPVKVELASCSHNNDYRLVIQFFLNTHNCPHAQTFYLNSTDIPFISFLFRFLGPGSPYVTVKLREVDPTSDWFEVDPTGGSDDWSDRIEIDDPIHQ